MQISDEMLRAARSKMKPFTAPNDATLRAAIEAALSLPVQPEPPEPFAYCCSSFDIDACDCVNKNHSTAIRSTGRTTTPPVQPTKGPEDDLIAAREAYASFEDRCGFVTFAQEIRAGLHDDKSAVQSALLALRSRPASALPVVGEWRSDWENAPKDKTIIAVGRYGDEWGGPNEYVYAGPPNHWSCKFHGVCIRPDYWDRYVFIVKPELPGIGALIPAVQP